LVPACFQNIKHIQEIDEKSWRIQIFSNKKINANVARKPPGATLPLALADRKSKAAVPVP